MANSDKNILITPSTSSATGIYPSIKMTGFGNTPITLSVLDDNSLSFSGSAGQLFSISNSLTGSIFSVNDISGIPSIEVLDTGLIKLNQYNGQMVIGSSAAITSSSVPAMISAVTRSATTPGLIIKGFASQSANLQEWQGSDGTILARLGNTGVSVASSFFTTGSAASGTNIASQFGTNSATRIPLVVQGAASQTADLQQWQNSAGTTLARVNADGAFDSVVLKSPEERMTVSATAATGTINFDADTQGVLYYTSDASANWTLNVRGSSGTTINSKLAIGDSTTIAFLVTNGSTAYNHSALTIDGSAQTVKWSGGTVPAAGNASSIDAYSFTIIKTASATYTVLGAGPVKYA